MTDIIAIDPSNKGNNGIAVWNCRAQDLRVSIEPLNEIFELFGSYRYGTSSSERPVVYCETVASYGMAVGRDVFETCFVIGEIRHAAKLAGIQFVHCYRKEIKIHLCGTVRAKDGNVRQALIDLWGQPGTKKEPGPTYGVKGDGWAALAVLSYAIDKEAVK